MNSQYVDCIQQILKIIDVDAGVQNFTNEWISSNPVLNSADILDIFDRLMIPYEVHPASDKLSKIQHQAAIYLCEDKATTCKYDLNQYFEFDNGTFVPAIKPNSKATDIVILVLDRQKERYESDWFESKLVAYKGIIPRLLGISLLANLFALSIPFITMSVYDHVIGGDARNEVLGISIGAILLFSMMLLLKVLRSQLLTTVANRISREITQTLLRKMIHVPLAHSRLTGASSFMSRITTAETIKGMVQGPLGGALFDLPFVIIFIVAIGILGTWLVIVPIIALILYFILAMRHYKNQALLNNQVTISGTTRYSLIYELNSKLDYLRSSQILGNWSTRFTKANRLASKNSFSQVTHQAKYTSIYYAIGLLSTVAVIGLGIELIFAQQLSAGGLIATMMLISRVTSPAQMLSNSYPRLGQYQQAKQQINQTILQKAEGEFAYQHHALTDSAPKIDLEQVTLRFPGQLKPALSGVTFAVEPGQVIAVTGPIGSGKTTLLEVLAGLCDIQNGVIKYNGHNLTQYDPQLLRQWLGFYGDQPQIIPLTIRNFIDDNRHVEEQEILDALDRVGASRWLASLEHGLDTHLNDLESLSHPLSSFEAHVLLRAKLNCHRYPLVILDNPVASNGEKEIFLEWLEANRGNSTIILTSHDPDIIKIADQVVLLDKGTVTYAGPIPEAEPQVETAEVTED
ncbi:ABC transporter transmembrane domain-containing protein [Vibrio gallicus]|uniref:ABC transporter transmembrane domain-containing protein n=1 Tax=Vibrio gallicus TaxID=190897 RepID=UPI0021C3648A|nr:ABC transporter transmembrane domain-containing protein [Vibrio gallicus]